MAMSGVKLQESAKTKCDEIKGPKGDKACLLKISKDQKCIEVDPEFECKCDEKRPYKKAMAACKLNNCRYVIANVKCKNGEGRVIDKVVCIHWASDKASIKEKMVSTTSYDAVKKSLTGVAFMEMNDDSDKKANTVLQKICEKGAAARRFEGRRYHVNSQNREYESSGDDSEED